MTLAREVIVKVRVEPTIMPAKAAPGGTTVASVLPPRHPSLPPRHPSLPPLPASPPSAFLTPSGPGEGVPRGSSAGLSSTFRGLGRAAMLGGGLLGAASTIGGPAGEMISGIGGGAMAGAAIGSAIPGIGTAVGAAVGGVVGVLTSTFSALGDSAKKAAERFESLASTLETAAARTRAVASGTISAETFATLPAEVRTRIRLASESGEGSAAIEAELSAARAEEVRRRGSLATVTGIATAAGFGSAPAGGGFVGHRTAISESASLVSVLELALKSGIEGITRPEGEGRTGFGGALSVSDAIIEGMATRSPEIREIARAADAGEMTAGAATAILDIVSRWAAPIT